MRADLFLDTQQEKIRSMFGQVKEAVKMRKTRLKDGFFFPSILLK